MAYKIVVDSGHGGEDPGAVYPGRQEKEDTLRLALEVGRLLEAGGQDVVYTRTTDVYQTPFEKAQIANREEADYFISIHRNSSPRPNQYQGVETLIYDKSGIKLKMAEAINGALEEVGFRNLGVKERPGLECCEEQICRHFWWRQDLLTTIRIISCLMKNLQKSQEQFLRRFSVHWIRKLWKIHFYIGCRWEFSEIKKMQTG